MGNQKRDRKYIKNSQIIQVQYNLLRVKGKLSTHTQNQYRLEYLIKTYKNKRKGISAETKEVIGMLSRKLGVDITDKSRKRGVTTGTVRGISIGCVRWATRAWR